MFRGAIAVLQSLFIALFLSAFQAWSLEHCLVVRRTVAFRAWKLAFVLRIWRASQVFSGIRDDWA